MPNLSTITKKNQITIPQSIISTLKLQTGGKVMIKKQNNWIKVTPLKKKSFVGLFGIIKSKKGYDHKKLRKQFEKKISK